MQNNDSVVQIFTIPEATSALWTEFAPEGVPAGWIHRLIGREDLPDGGIERISLWKHDGGHLPYEPAAPELVVILQGRAQLTQTDGECFNIDTGQIALVSASFRGTWTTEEPLIKLSAVLPHS